MAVGLMCASLRCHTPTPFGGRLSATGTRRCLLRFLLDVWLVISAVAAAAVVAIVETMYRLLAQRPWMIVSDSGSEIGHVLSPNIAVKLARSSMLMENREL